MAYHRGSTLVAQREYVYDSLGRPTSRNTARQGSVGNDTFTHNTRSELAAATVNGEDYAYLYDNIGNRKSAVEGDDSTVYTANALNQYTAIQENTEAAFLPEFDADGNQTLIKTDTGIWSSVYNAENRPVIFTNNESNTVVECAYDTMGRRAFKKVITNGSVTLHQRYIYRGYLQIACCDLTRTNHPALWLITWDPSQPVATRPLAIQKNGTWYTYGLDLTKNVCEVFGSSGYIGTAYTYTPFGEVTASGNMDQPIQWSSEFHDSELGLVYYNWRYYNSLDGRWMQFDFIFATNAYLYMNPSKIIDIKGLKPDINWFLDTIPNNTDGTIYEGLTSAQMIDKAVTYKDYFVIVAHGTERTIKNKKNQHLSPGVMADIIYAKGYNFDKTILLLSCSTGAHPKGFAQILANNLEIIRRNIQCDKKSKIKVLAPNQILIITYTQKKYGHTLGYYKMHFPIYTPYVGPDGMPHEKLEFYKEVKTISINELKSFTPKLK